MGFIKDLVELFGSSGDGFTVSGKTAIKGLKRGDYAKVLTTISDCPFKRGDEVMISAIDAKNNRYVDCVNYKREYGRIHETHLTSEPVEVPRRGVSSITIFLGFLSLQARTKPGGTKSWRRL